MQRKKQKYPLYSIDKYQRTNKWCFAIVLNRALDNINPSKEKEIGKYKNKELFYKSLLRFEGIKKQPWFDGTKVEKENATAKEIIDSKDRAVELLLNLRNFFSHIYHTEKCLYFGSESPNNKIRLIMEAAYERAKAELAGRRTGQEVSQDADKDKDGNIKKYKLSEVPWPPLFDEKNMITSAGVLFFASLFTERSHISRLMGWIEGLKKNEDKFNITRKAISYYAMPDSYAEAIAEYEAEKNEVGRTIRHKAKAFRDILNYLRRIPSETYKLYHSKEENKKSGKDEEKARGNHVERKTDKFAHFAMQYLEDYEGVKFARYRINTEVRKNEVFFDKDKLDELITEKGVPEQEKDKKFEDYRYYYIDNNAILNTEKGSIRIGVNELKYLVLLSLADMGQKAKGEINSFISKFTEGNLKNKGFISDNRENTAPFILKKAGILTEDEKKKIKKRVEYLTEKWRKKQKDCEKLRINDKVGGILRYVNENLKSGKKLDPDGYNYLQKLLTMERFSEFETEINKFEDERESRLKRGSLSEIKGLKSIDEMFSKVCSIVLEKLESLKGDELAGYIGLKKQMLTDEKAAKNQEYDNVLHRYIETKIALPKGTLRDLYFKNGVKKNFSDAVEEILKKKAGCFNIELDKKYYDYEIDKSKETKDKEGLKTVRKLRETMAKDRLCLLTGMKFYEDIREKLNIQWQKENGKNVIYADICEKGDKQKKLFTLKFSEKDYVKMYVIDRPEFLARIWKHFFKEKEKQEIDYYELYQRGIQKGLGDFQRDVALKVLKFEEAAVKKIIGGELSIGKVNNRLSEEIKKRARELKSDFDVHKDNFVDNDTICKAFFDDDKDIQTVKKIRNSAFHYNADFENEDYTCFNEIMDREGIKIKEIDGKKQEEKQRKHF
jgi:hypothetical protein